MIYVMVGRFNVVPTYGETCEIVKVYKSGNFLVSNKGPQQFRPRFDGRAHATGSDYHSSTLLALLTDEVRADIDRSAKYLAAYKIVSYEIDRLTKIQRSRDVDLIIGEAAKMGTAA